MAGIDFETDGFFGNMASMRMDIEKYEKWCERYEEFRYKYPEWITKSGSGVPVWKMDDNHLDNTINLIQMKDKENNWLKVLNQEKTYRSLKKEIVSLKNSLARYEEIADKVF